MQSPTCPECGTRRDVEFRRDESGRLVLACVPCGIERPCCPYCRTSKVGYTPQGTMRCALCQREFIPPETRDFDWTHLTESQLNWLVKIGNRFRLARLENFETWEGRTGKSQKDYVRNHLRRFLVIPRLLKEAPHTWSEEEVEQKILAENMYVASERSFRLRKAKELLGLLQDAANVS